MSQETPATKPGNNPTGAAPTAPAVASKAKTASKTPAEINLEKKVAVLEDELSTVRGWMAETNKFLAGLGGGAAPARPATGGAVTPARAGGAFDEANEILFGSN